jgi:transcriptional regulator with XRE-family HTH domain
MAERPQTDVAAISPEAWRLLRVAAGFSQRDVEREVDEVMQAHISMLESGTRALSVDRRQRLLTLYAAELSAEQVDALVEHF